MGSCSIIRFKNIYFLSLFYDQNLTRDNTYNLERIYKKLKIVMIGIQRCHTISLIS